MRTKITERRNRAAAAEQITQEIAGSRHCIGILRAAIILRERHEDGTALVVAIGVETGRAQLLKACHDLIQIGAHLLDLVVDRSALGRLAVEQREEARTVASHAPGLPPDAIEFPLLPGGGILVAADLVIPGRVAAAAAVDGYQLRFQPRADRVHRSPRRRRESRILLRRDAKAEAEPGQQRRAGQHAS